jgi:hypothetical protein
MEFSYLTVKDGGTGVQIKTEVSTDSLTWYGRSFLDSNYIHHVRIQSVRNEAFYLGSTAPFVFVATTTVLGIFFCDDVLPDTTTHVGDFNFYKRAVAYHHTRLDSIDVDTCGNDAYQLAAQEDAEVSNCNSTEWGYNNHDGDKGFVLIGGYCLRSFVHDNRGINTTNGQGIWMYGQGPDHRVVNNLVWNFAGEGVSDKGGEFFNCDNNFNCTYVNNTFAVQAYGVGMRFSGQMGGTQHRSVLNNLIISVPNDPGFGFPLYYRCETYNGHTGDTAVGTSANNLTYTSVAAAMLDATNYLQPLPGSPVGIMGYRIYGITSSFHFVKRIAVGTNVKLKRS